MTYFPEGNVQTGIASWYGADFHGWPTSSKEIYDMNDMTAAHRTLPLGTYVMVTNLNNGKSVIVRVNDRGPFVKERIIDLSYAAARMLDMIVSGTVPVKIEVLKKHSPPPSTRRLFVQVGSFIIKNNAINLKKRLEKDFKDVSIQVYETEYTRYFRVRIKAKNRNDALRIAQELNQRGFPVLIFEEQ